jgi:hypothetical protein
VDRKELRARLQDVAPPLAQIYAGARQILEQPSLPGKALFLAHAAREIANGLPEWITRRSVRKESQWLADLALRWQEAVPDSDLPEGAAPSPGSTTVPQDLAAEISLLLKARTEATASRDAIQGLFEWLGPGNRYLKTDLPRLVKEWMDLRRWFEASTHAPRRGGAAEADEREAVTQFERFERWLYALLGGFFAIQRDLDLILDEATPDQLPELLPLLVADQNRRHFFERLAAKGDPSWLEPLRTNGLFVPPPVVTKDDTHTHAAWPAGRYLIRMAAEPAAHETVATIARGVLSGARIDNEFVQNDLTDVALALPAGLAAPLAKKMRSWGGGFTDKLAKKLGTLATRLAQGGEVSAGCRLMEGLLATKRTPAKPGLSWQPDPKPRIGDWPLHSVVEKILPAFVDTTRLEGLRLVSKSLERALSAARAPGDQPGEDYSHIWKPIIGGQSVLGDSAQELLVSAVVRSASQLATAQEPVEDIVKVLDSRGWAVFRRIAQDLLRQFPADAPKALRRHLLDPRQFESFRREYRMLLEATFNSLDAADQKTILGWIETGPLGDTVREHLSHWSEREPSDEDVVQWSDGWRHARLGPLAKHLGGPWLDRLSALTSRFGETPPADSPDFRTSVGTGFSAAGSGVPWTHEEVRSWTARQLAERLKALGAGTDGPVEGPEDLGRMIAVVVKEAPARFAADAAAFKELESTYVRAVLNGLEAAIREGGRFDWEPVVDLAAWVLQQEPVLEPIRDHWGEDRGWEWSRGAVIRLVRAGLGQPGAAPPNGLSGRLWALIEALANDPPSIREEAVGAAIEYALWLKQDGGELLATTPEAARFLEQQLDERMAKPQVHAEFGRWLGWLAWHSPAWVEQHLDRILPASQELWTAAWRSFVRGRVPPSRVFAVLREAYVRAIDQLRTPEATGLPGLKDEVTLDQEQLTVHLLTFYGWGVLDQANAAGILDLFFERAQPALRQYALRHIGFDLREDEDGQAAAKKVPSEVLARFQALWSKRVARLSTDPLVREELPAFGPWFACGRFPDAWALDQVEFVLEKSTEPILDQHGVIRRLSRIADIEPVRAARILSRMAQLSNEPSWPYGWLDESRTILGAAIRSGDPGARKAAIAFLDRLGALGFRDVRSLVPSSQDLDDPLAIPHFLWDQPLTVAQFKERLATASEAERDRLLGLLLREARDVDVWRFTSPDEVQSRWSGIERHLGRRREFWRLLLAKWREQGLLAR